MKEGNSSLKCAEFWGGETHGKREKHRGPDQMQADQTPACLIVNLTKHFHLFNYILNLYLFHFNFDVFIVNTLQI